MTHWKSGCRISAIVFIVIAMMGSIAALVLWRVAPRPDLMPQVGYSTAWFDRHGELLRLTLAPDERYRLWTPLDKISPAAIEATLLYEDQRFYSHFGVDPLALIRATLSLIIPGQRRVGASTITMQLVRLHDQMNTRTFAGKLQQILRALQFERHYSKDQILEAYLNLAPYGGNIEGFGTASLIYFHQQAADLTLPQAMLLSVIPQHPVQRHPVTGDRPILLAARERLLSLWLAKHPDDAARENAFRLPIQVNTIRELPFRAPHFVNRLLADQKKSSSHHTAQEHLFNTTLDLKLQTHVEQLAQQHIARRASQDIRNTAILLIHYPTMEVVSELGSIDFFDDSIQGQVNGTQAPRSPGSALKPFIYALALQHGLIHPKTLLKDTPHRFAAYTPENFDQRFVGPLSATDALVQSRNVPAVALLQALGDKGLHTLLKQAEIADLKPADHYGLALALGGMELTMTELVELYAMLANQGIHRPTRSLFHAQENKRPLLTPEAAWLTRTMLTENPPPHRYRRINATNSPDIAWKTGTSYAFRDAWSVGITGPWVIAVWMGNFDGAGNPSFVGRTAAAPLFFQIAQSLPLEFPSATPSPNFNKKYDPDLPDAELQLTRVTLCRRTGQLPEKECPATETGWFIPGVSPIGVSQVFKKLPVDRATGRLSCNPDPTSFHEELFEFWPADFHTLWRLAGLPVRTPPAWMPECRSQFATLSTPAPIIQSPSADLTYTFSAQSQNNTLPFQAVAYPPAKTLYWFVDNQFVGQTDLTTPFHWEMVSGNYRVTVVDDLGQGSSVAVKIISM